MRLTVELAAQVDRPPVRRIGDHGPDEAAVSEGYGASVTACHDDATVEVVPRLSPPTRPDGYRCARHPAENVSG
jgi:hypothetical protein